MIRDKIGDKKSKDGRPFPNSHMCNAHAEVGALQQAANKGLTEGADAVMKVTGKDVCDYCRKDVVAMAKASKLNSLKIFAETKTAYKTYEWEAGMARFKITENPKW
nr:hypothetical protein [Snodgrassella communis]